MQHEDGVGRMLGSHGGKHYNVQADSSAGLAIAVLPDRERGAKSVCAKSLNLARMRLGFNGWHCSTIRSVDGRRRKHEKDYAIGHW